MTNLWEISGTIKDILKNMQSMPLVRKNHILQFITSFMIVVRFVLSQYDFLGMLNLPKMPLISSNIRSIIVTITKIALGLLIIFRITERPIIYNYIVLKIMDKVLRKDELLMNLSFAIGILEGVMSLQCLIYAIMVMINYTNGINDNMFAFATIIAFLYMVYSIFEGLYYSHRIAWKKWHMCYTPNCDSRGKRIPIDSFVFYKGRRYRVAKGQSNEYVLLDGYSYGIIPGNIIKLDEAAADNSEKLWLE